MRRKVVKIDKQKTLESETQQALQENADGNHDLIVEEMNKLYVFFASKKSKLIN